MLGRALVFGAGIKPANAGIAIGDKLDNQIFELGQLAPWKVKIHQLLFLKYLLNFYSFDLYTAPMHVHMAYRIHTRPSKTLFTD